MNNSSLYTCVYTNGTQTGDREQAMSAFRGYLESRADDLAKNQDLAAYFALPYVPDPSKHPSFKNLFLVRTCSSIASDGSIMTVYHSCYCPTKHILCYMNPHRKLINQKRLNFTINFAIITITRCY